MKSGYKKAFTQLDTQATNKLWRYLCTGYQHTLWVSARKLPAKLNHPITLRVSVHRLPTTLNSPIGYLCTDTLKIEQSDYFDDITIYSEYQICFLALGSSEASRSANFRKVISLLNSITQ